MTQGMHHKQSSSSDTHNCQQAALVSRTTTACKEDMKSTSVAPELQNVPTVQAEATYWWLSM